MMETKKEYKENPESRPSSKRAAFFNQVHHEKI